jgi:peroxiredoxin
MSMRQRCLIFLLLIFWACGQTEAQALIGTNAFPLSAKNPNGKVISLDSLRGKWVLVDFWASWCRPCRQSNRVVRKFYPKWKEKGIEVFGVSLDENRSAWIKAIQSDKITWPQVNTAVNWDSPLIAQWQINRIPTTFLIDPAGVIRVIDPDPGAILSFISKH